MANLRIKNTINLTEQISKQSQNLRTTRQTRVIMQLKIHSENHTQK